MRQPAISHTCAPCTTRGCATAALELTRVCCGCEAEQEPMASVQPHLFGELLRRYRIAAGLTQEELAARAQLSARAIGALETGERRVPHNETVARLMEALDLTEEHRAMLRAAARRRH